MSLQNLIEKLQCCASNGERIAICQESFEEITTKLLEMDTEVLHIIVKDLVSTVTFPFDKYGEAQARDEGFAESCEYARFVCELLGIMTKRIDQTLDNRNKVFSCCLPHYIKHCAQMNQTINQWCDKQSEECANDTLNKILEVGGFASLKEAMNTRENTIFRNTFDLILPDLKRERWKDTCSARSTFIYLIKEASGDLLVENLDAILPFTLILTDDFVVSNSIAGIKCMNRILDEVPSSELRLRGRADVFHDCLSKKLFTREAEVAKVLIPCVLQSLNCLEPEMMRKRGCSIPKHDECFDTILNNFHLSSDAVVKRIYSEAIPLFISRMGIHSIGHMKTFLIIFNYAMETSNLPTIANCAKMVSELVNAAWPRVAHHSEKLLESLVKALYNIENDEWRNRNACNMEKTRATDAIIEAMAMLALVSKDLVMETADMFKTEEVLGLQKYGCELVRIVGGKSG